MPEEIKMTDAEWIEKLKELAPALWLCTGGSRARPPFEIYHPYCHLPARGARFFSPEELAERFAKTEKHAEKMRQERDWFAYLNIAARPYRVRQFEVIADEMTDEEYWENLSGIYNDSENTSQDKRLWKKLFQSPRPKKEFFMDERERQFLADLPENVTIYRGYHPRGKVSDMNLPSNRLGRSWSLSKDVALKFTNFTFGIGTFSSGGKTHPDRVREMTINKSEIFAYLGGREEEEIVFQRPR